MRTFAIILAAGDSKRAGKDKLDVEISGKKILEHSIAPFDFADELIVVSQKRKFNAIKKILKKNSWKARIVEGGKQRQDSVFNALMSIKNAKQNDIIIVHNGANPLVSQKEIKDCVLAAQKFGAAALGYPLRDTIKKEEKGFVVNTLKRENVWQIQTPQCIKYGIFMKAIQQAKKDKIYATDDVALVERLAEKVKLVECSTKNFKITTKSDIELANSILGGNFTVGIGEDHHRFAKGKKLVLGGAIIPGSDGLDANSDGDIMLHSAFNAISSAISGRSLGMYADKMARMGIKSSQKYIEVILKESRQKGFRIEKISFSIEAKKPRLEIHHDKIVKSLCRIFRVKESQMGLTFTSGDEISEFGRGLGMKCSSIALLRR